MNKSKNFNINSFSVELEGSSLQYTDESNEGREVVIFNLSIDKEERGKKLGYKLLDKAIKEIMSKGYKTIFLIPEPYGDTNMTVEKLTKYYTNYGFIKKTDSREMDFNKRLYEN